MAVFPWKNGWGKTGWRPLALCLSAMPAAVGDDGASLPDGDVETIVVVGERVARRLLDAASSVTVFDTAVTEREAGRHINDMLLFAPNVLVEGISEVPTIRGIQGGGGGGIATGAAAGSLPRLTTVVDGVPQVAALPNAAFADLYDIRQVEVARGPQTTLFGRNALAGAIIVETNDPTFDPEAEIQVTGLFDDVSDGDYVLSGFVSGPLAGDTLAGRLTVQYRDGDDPREVVGTPPGADDGFLTDFDALRLRGKLLGRFDTGLGALEVNALVDYQTGTTPQTRNIVTGPDAGGGAFGDRVILFNGPNRTFDNDAVTGALDAVLDLGGGRSLQSLTSYTRVQYDSVDAQVFPSLFETEERFFAQDLIFRFGQEEGRRLSGLAGAALEDRSQDAVIAGIPVNSDAATESVTLSAFADLRFALSSAVELTAGGRVLSIDQDRDQAATSFFPGLPAGAVGFSDEETVFLPSVGVLWTLQADQTLRATFRQGFNAGGAAINFLTLQPYTYASERLSALEAGYRGAFLDGRLFLSATAFFNWYDDQQFFLETTPGDRNTIIVANVPDSESYGLEVEVRADVTDTVTLSGAVGLLETEIGAGPASNPTFDGNDFGRDPGVTANLAALWSPVDALTLDARVNYVSGYFPTFDNIPGSRVGDYVLMDVGVTYDMGRYAIRAFVRNAGDETALISRVGAFAGVAPPRTFGVTLTARAF